MNDGEKLKHLLHHWLEHNLEHAGVYRDWAGRVSAAGNEELSHILASLCDETKKLNRLIEEALKKV